jgi:hypothetical protein
MATCGVGCQYESWLQDHVLPLIRLSASSNGSRLPQASPNFCLGPTGIDSEWVSEREVCRAPLNRDHSFRLQLIETNGPPAQGKDESLDGPVDPVTLRARPFGVHRGHSETGQQFVSHKVPTGQQGRSDEGHATFRDCVVSLSRCRGFECRVHECQCLRSWTSMRGQEVPARRHHSPESIDQFSSGTSP